MVSNGFDAVTPFDPRDERANDTRRQANLPEPALAGEQPVDKGLPVDSLSLSDQGITRDNLLSMDTSVAGAATDGVTRQTGKPPLTQVFKQTGSLGFAQAAARLHDDLERLSDKPSSEA